MASEPDWALRIGGAEASIEFGGPETAANGSGTRIPLRIVARGITVSTAAEIEAWSGGPSSLINFFADLALAWRGWSGSKEWRDDGPNIVIHATHDGIRQVELETTVMSHSGWHGGGSWTAAVCVPVEPGALQSIAVGIAGLVAPHGRPPRDATPGPDI